MQRLFYLIRFCWQQGKWPKTIPYTHDCGRRRTVVPWLGMEEEVGYNWWLVIGEVGYVWPVIFWFRFIVPPGQLQVTSLLIFLRCEHFSSHDVDTASCSFPSLASPLALTASYILCWPSIFPTSFGSPMCPFGNVPLLLSGWLDSSWSWHTSKSTLKILSEGKYLIATFNNNCELIKLKISPRNAG